MGRNGEDRDEDDDEDFLYVDDNGYDDMSDDASGDASDEDMSKVESKRFNPVVLAFITAFVILALIAVTTVWHGVSARTVRNHNEALSACVAARKGFAITYTSYQPTMDSAKKLSQTPQSKVGDSDSVHDLAQAIAPFRDGVSELSMSSLNRSDCNDGASTQELHILADQFGSGETTMINRMIIVQYKADNVKKSIDSYRHANVRGDLQSLLPKATLAFDRSDRKVDDGVRAVLDNAIAGAKAAMDDTQITNDQLIDQNGTLQSAYDVVIGQLPDDCHFHPCVALTFDDGPNKQFTGALLDTLDKAQVPATFFLQGQFVNGSNVDIVKREVREGHAVGSMSWRHTQLQTLSDMKLFKWFADTDQVISDVTGQPVTLFRPPDGAWTDEIRSQAQNNGQSLILWSVDSQDWQKGAKSSNISRAVLDSAGSGSIVSMHDGNQQTIEALPAIIEGLRSQGLRFVTIPELLDGDLQPGNAYYSLGDVDDPALD